MYYLLLAFLTNYWPISINKSSIKVIELSLLQNTTLALFLIWAIIYTASFWAAASFASTILISYLDTILISSLANPYFDLAVTLYHPLLLPP